MSESHKTLSSLVDQNKLERLSLAKHFIIRDGLYKTFYYCN